MLGGKALHNDLWQREGMRAAVDGFRRMIGPELVKPKVPVGNLDDQEIGLLVAEILFAWISTTAKQATCEGLPVNAAITSMSAPGACFEQRADLVEPWAAGAVDSILPDLAEVPGLDFTVPLQDLARHDMVRLAWACFCLTACALAARDNGAAGVMRRPERQMREISAAAGGPLMTPDERNEFATIIDAG